MKPRDPAAHIKAKGALRTRTIADKKKANHRKRKHKGR